MVGDGCGGTGTVGDVVCSPCQGEGRRFEPGGLLQCFSGPGSSGRAFRHGCLPMGGSPPAARMSSPRSRPLTTVPVNRLAGLDWAVRSAVHPPHDPVPAAAPPPKFLAEVLPS